MPSRTFLCRCEDVTVKDIDDAVARGLVTIEEIKRYTGLGTGPCQGKECLSGLVSLLCDRGLCDRDLVRPFTTRPPTEPVSLAALAAIEHGAFDGPSR